MHFFFNNSIAKTDKLPLDSLAGITSSAAYSLRKLKSTASRAIQVRRSSDNTALDIGFSGKNLDTSALLSFVGTENLIQYSENLSGTGWSTVSGSSFAAGTEIAPNGTASAGTLTFSATNGKHLYSVSGLTANTQYTFSIYMKTASGTFALKMTRTNQLTWVSAAVSNELSVTNTWARYSVTFTTGAAETVANLILGDEDKTAYTLPSTGSVYAWGAQLNQGDTPKTYNKTNGGIGGDGYVTIWYDQSGGTNNQIQATAANQPRVVTAGVLETTANGRPSVAFFQNLSYMVGSSMTVSTNNSVLFVKNISTIGRNYYIGVPGDAWYIGSSVVNTASWVYDAASNTIFAGHTVGLDIVTMTSDTTNSSWNFYKNSTNIYNASAGPNTWDGVTGTLLLNSRSSSAGSFSTNVKFNEVILYNVALTDKDRAKLETSAIKYYGIV